jgi:glycosyltransferase involved in cell wall biosynthesis
MEKNGLISNNRDFNAPLISIILVCLNSEKTIEQTILSIIKLDYPNIEFIVIDGVSTDGTIKILEKYNEYIDNLIIEKDSGIYDAMNKGSKLANGMYLYFIGSDDIVINSWNNLIGKLNSPSTIFYGNVYFPISNKIYDGRFGFVKLLTKNICHQAIFYPKAVFEKYEYSTEYPFSADFLLNLQINSDSDFNFKYINLLISIYSEQGLSSCIPDHKFIEDHLSIIKKDYSLIVYLYIFLRKLLSKTFLKRKKNG